MIKAPGIVITATLLALTILVLAGCGSSAISAKPGQEEVSSADTDPVVTQIALEIPTIF